MASAGPHASLHLAPDRQPCQHPTTQAGCPSCRPTNSVKALKAKCCTTTIIIIIICHPMAGRAISPVTITFPTKNSQQIKIIF